MKASRLIEDLKKLIDKHGDLPVRTYDVAEKPVTMVAAYNENGSTEKDDGVKEDHFFIF